MLTASSVVLSSTNIGRIDDLNHRVRNLQQNAEEKESELASMGSGGHVPSVIAVIPPGMSSVSPPWERSVTGTKVPYYVK